MQKMVCVNNNLSCQITCFDMIPISKLAISNTLSTLGIWEYTKDMDAYLTYNLF